MASRAHASRTTALLRCSLPSPAGAGRTPQPPSSPTHPRPRPRLLEASPPGSREAGSRGRQAPRPAPACRSRSAWRLLSRRAAARPPSSRCTHALPARASRSRHAAPWRPGLPLRAGPDGRDDDVSLSPQQPTATGKQTATVSGQ